MGFKTEIGILTKLVEKVEGQIADVKQHESETETSTLQISGQLKESYSILYLRIFQIIGKQGLAPKDVYKVSLSDKPVFERDLATYVDQINTKLGEAIDHQEARTEQASKLIVAIERDLGGIKDGCNQLRVLMDKKLKKKEKELSKDDYQRYEVKCMNYYESIKDLFKSAKDLEEEAGTVSQEVKSNCKRGIKYLDSIGKASMSMTVLDVENQSKDASAEIKHFETHHSNKRSPIKIFYDKFRKVNKDTLQAQFKTLEGVAKDFDKD